MRGVHPNDLALYQQGLKKCYHCTTIKPLTDFTISKKGSSVSGRSSWCRACHRKDGNEFYQRIKLEAFRRYSVTPYPSCCCCTETITQFLCIDHINGGGNAHRKEVGTGIGFYRWLRRNEFPEGFQTLCHNCNHAKWAYGACVHDLYQ